MFSEYEKRLEENLKKLLQNFISCATALYFDAVNMGSLVQLM